jgi:hypothetical protein
MLYFRFLHSVLSKKITIQKNIFFFVSPYSFLFLSFPSPSISLSSILYPLPFSPSLSFRYIRSTCAQLSLSLLIAHFAPSFLSFRPITVFSSLVPTSKSRHHFSFFCTLSPQELQNYTSYRYSLLYLDSLILSLFSCLSVSLSLSLSSTVWNKMIYI